jgi:hypothetical protein
MAQCSSAGVTKRLVTPGQSPPLRNRDPGSAGGGGDLTEELLTTDAWSDAMVAAAGIPIVDVPLLSIGGMGSFVTVDYRGDQP